MSDNQKIQSVITDYFHPTKEIKRSDWTKAVNEAGDCITHPGATRVQYHFAVAKVLSFRPKYIPPLINAYQVRLLQIEEFNKFASTLSGLELKIFFHAIDSFGIGDFFNIV